MAGYREFQTGEVLTAANVNDYLAKQSVMKFADAAARDTALGTAVGGANALREGMVAYLDSTDEVLFYDGTSWGAVGLPLGTATPTDGQILTFGTATSSWNPSPQLAGIGSNVVQATKVNSFSTTSTSFTDLGLSATITPSSATAKVLVLVQLSVGGRFDQNVLYNLVRGATNLFQSTAATTNATLTMGNFPNEGGVIPIVLSYLDSPATTSATTYKMQMRVTASDATINRPRDTADYGGTSSITLIEVAA